MRIVVNLDVMMARRKMSLGELAQRVDITMANLSILKNNKARAIRFSTLEAICAALDCQPGDILEFVPGFFMAGLLFLVMSALFRQAAALQEDQNLTI